MRRMTASSTEQYLHLWNLEADGTQIETPSSWLLPVRHGDGAAFLKVMKSASDEGNAAAFLRYVAGDGAVRLLAADDHALLLERATGPRSLKTMAISGEDVGAAEILAQTVAKLHAPRGPPLPDGLYPLRDWFSSLFAREAQHPLLRRCAAIARALLGSEREVLPLHGDLHHDNVLDGGERGWLAVDPKGVIGERTYEVANLLGNPWPHGEIVHDADRLQRLAALYAARLGLDVRRVIAFAFAHAGLAASWHMDDGGDPAYRLKCAEVFAPLVDDRSLTP
jgi:streptomycin 6-kinase